MKYIKRPTRLDKFSRRIPERQGMTLLEVMVAVAFIAVAALGTLCYEYLCVDHVRIARAELIATRIGQLLIEDWKSTGGSLDYNPEDLNMGFDLPDGLPTNCVTVVDGLPLHISMTHADVDGGVDTFAGTKLSEISVVVSWKKDFSGGTPEDDDPRVALVTYVRQDQ
jgi:prepilin-type N-terminal cleavage/methylation domain-containing protein